MPCAAPIIAYITHHTVNKQHWDEQLTTKFPRWTIKDIEYMKSHGFRVLNYEEIYQRLSRVVGPDDSMDVEMALMKGLISPIYMSINSWGNYWRWMYSKNLVSDVRDWILIQIELPLEPWQMRHQHQHWTKLRPINWIKCSRLYLYIKGVSMRSYDIHDFKNHFGHTRASCICESIRNTRIYMWVLWQEALIKWACWACYGSLTRLPHSDPNDNQQG